jgi:hypothetical protein
MKSTALESWLYRNPLEIIDGQRAKEKRKKREAERNRRHKSLRIKSLTRKVVMNGGSIG